MKKTFRKKAKAFVGVLQNAQQHTIGLLMFLTMALIVIYIYFIGITVVYAIDREETRSTIADAGSRIAELEVDYLKGKNNITRNLATTLGFSAISQKDYITRSRYLGQASINQ